MNATGMLRRGIGAWILASALTAAEPIDPVTTVAATALAAGKPVQVVDLLRDHPGLRRPGQERLLLARAQLALARPRLALQALATPLDDAAAWSAWPPGLRGPASAIAGEAAIAVGGQPAAARRLLAEALGAEGVETDRCLVLLAELCQSSGETPAASAYAGKLWSGFPRSPHRARAGLLLAEVAAAAQPLRARELLAEVRAQNDLPPALRLAAAELLCRLLIAERPGQCLVVAEQESRHLGGSALGELPLYRALALGSLDPGDGLKALEALPEPQRSSHAAVGAQERLRQVIASGRRADARQVIERAEALAELERWPEVQGLVAPLAMDEPAALVLLARAPGSDLAGYAGSLAARHPGAALALGRALVQAGKPQLAWPPLASAIARRDAGEHPEVPLAALLYWGAAAARAVSPPDCAKLTARLLALDQGGVEVGLAWCAEAGERERAGGDAATAWRRAAAALPADHPWQAAAAWRAARALLAADGDLNQIEQLLAGPAAEGAGEDQVRCRFLLAQVFERLGKREQALDLARALRDRAGPEQRSKLEAMIERLQAHDGVPQRGH